MGLPFVKQSRQTFQGGSMGKWLQESKHHYDVDIKWPWLEAYSLNGLQYICRSESHAKVQDCVVSMPYSWGFLRHSSGFLNSAAHIVDTLWMISLTLSITFFTLLFRWTARHECSAIKPFLDHKQFKIIVQEKVRFEGVVLS